MYVRCRNCHDTVWIRPSACDGGADRLKCDRCGEENEIQLTGRPASGPEELSRRAAEYAKDYGIDLASAYSVMFGLMSLGDVLALHTDLDCFVRDESAPVVAGSTAPARFDPAFKETVDAGRLTPAEAWARGNREKYAARLAQRHGLPQSLALAVADNRISLLEAFRRRAPRPKTPIRSAAPIPRPSSRAGRRSGWAVAAVLTLAAGALGLQWLGSQEDAQSSRTRATVGSAEILADDSGRVVRVIAEGPQEVLDAYCQRGRRRGRLLSVGVMPAASASSTVRIGLFRHPAEDSLMAIAIRRDATSGRWFAGDGHRPLLPRQAPPNAHQALLRR